MDPSYSCIEHDVKIKEEPIDEYEENISNEHSIHLKNGWFEFKCNSGKVLFYFNIITNEHRWMGNKCTCLKEDVEEANSESIGIQCDIDDRSKPILSKDVATEIDFSLLVVQESRNAVSVQTEVSFLQNNSSFRDIGVMTFSEDESISPSESISTESDPLIHDNNEQVGTLKNVVDPEDVTKDPTLTLNSSSTKDEPGDHSKDDELIKKENPKVLSQLDDDKHLQEHHSDDENSPKQSASLKNSDCENLSEEKSSASSCDTANEHNEGTNAKIVDENTNLNDIVSEEQYSKERDRTSLIVQSDNHVIAKTSSENDDLSEVEKRCEETGVISAHICKNFNENESSDVLSHGNPPKDEQWEQGSDLRPSNEAFQVENLNTPSDNSVEKDLHQEDACLSFEKTIDEQSFDNTTKDIENSCDDVCDLENDQPKEDQYKESEQHATQVSCQKIGRQTARKCADSLRKCLIIQKKAPELSNTETSTKDKRKCLRKRTLKKRICTDRFSKRLKVLVIPLEQDLPRIEGQLKSTCNTGTNDTVALDNIIHIVKLDHSYLCSEEERQSQTEHEVSESESYNIGDIIPSRKNSGPTSIEPQNGAALFPNTECSDENKQSENDQPLVGRNHEVSVVNQVFEKSIEDEFQNKDDQNEPKQRPKNPDNNRQEDLSIKEICVKKSNGFDENDERDTQGKAKDKIQNLEDQLKHLPKMDENGIVFNENDCQDRNIDNNNDENQNKATKTNQHLEDHLEDFSMKEENEEVSNGNEPQNRNVEKNEENDAQKKAKQKTEKLKMKDNQENVPMTDTNYQVSKEIETQNENSVKNNEDKAENKTDEHRAKDEPQRNDQANLVVGYTLKDGSGGIPNEMEIEKPKRCGDASQKEADETKSKYESQNQEKCPQNISVVEASGQVSIESEQVSQGNEDIRNVTDEGDSEDIMPERGDNETFSIMNSQSDELNTSIKPLLTEKVVKVTQAANKDAVRYPNTRYRRPDLKCKICGRGFKSRFKLSCHLKGHNRVKTNTCRFCLRTFRSYSLLCDHLKYHNMVSKYRCSYCNESFISHQKLVSHFIKCSETKTTPQNSSSISDTAKCEVPSSETSPLKNDRQLDNVTSPTTNELICNICKMAYVYPTSFKKHLDLHAAMPNGPANEKALKESYKSFENYISSGNSKLKSVLGDVTSPKDSNGDPSESQTILSGVSKDENDESPLDCPVCGMHFKMEYWLNYHVKKKHGMSAMETSTVLGDVTSSTDSNDDPSKSQTSPSGDSKGGNDESPISCQVCGMHFKLEYWLNCHIKKKHGMEYWLSCHIKKKRGVSAMETSTVLKDVTSPTDSNAEVSESQAIPSGESKDENYKSPLDCPVCGMLFKKEYWLNYHIGKKHGMSAMGGPPETNRDSKTNTSNNAKENPRCLENDTSPKTMATESTNIQTNKEGEIGENIDKLVSSPLKCKDCGIQFKRESWYDRHMKKKHLMSKERFALLSSPQASEHKNDETWETSKGTKESQENHVLAQGRTENVPEDGPKHSEGKQVFQCDICNRGFIYFGSLGNHMKHKHPGLENRNHNEKTRTDVPEIPKDANLKSAFEVKKNAGKAGRSFLRTEVCSNNDNVVIGYKQNNFKCCECPEEFPHLDDLIKHSSEKHVARKCPHCEHSCSSTEELHSHAQIHRREAAADRIKKICCKICGKEVSTALELITHFRTHKRGRKRKIDETQDAQSTSKSIEPTGSSSSDAPNSKIGIEGSLSQYPDETLSQRAIQNLSESSNPIVSNPTSKNNIRLSVFFCLVCNKAFSNIRKRSLHMKRSHPDSKKKKVFIQTNHKVAHRYKCPACGRNFRKIKYFNEHKCENKDMEPTELLTDNTEPSFVSRNTFEVNEGSQNSDGRIPQDRLFSKGHTPAINGDPCFDPSTERCVSGDTDIKMKCNSPRRKHWKCSICDRSFYKIKSYNKHKRSHEIMQSTEPTDVPNNNLSCSPTDILPSKDINTSAIQDNLGLVPSGDLVPLPRKDESAYTPDKPKETTRQKKISKISNIETIWEDKNAVGTESASVCNSETSSGASSTNGSKNETRSPSKSVFQYLNLETHSCGNLVGNEFKCYYCSLSFSSFYRRNSHVFTTHKRESKQRHPRHSPMETNQGKISQDTNDTSPQMVLNSYELPKSMDKEFFNSRMQDVNVNDESFKKKKHVPNILRKTNIERSDLIGQDNGLVLETVSTRNDS